MKFFLLLFAVFLCLAMKLPAQDRDPQVYNFSASSATAARSDSARSAFHGFVLGFNWGALPYPLALIDSLKIDVLHELVWLYPDPPRPEGIDSSAKAFFDSLATLRPGKKLIHSDFLLSQGKPAPCAWGLSMEFDPNIANTSSPFRFQERYKDSLATWGFNFNRIGRIPTLQDTSTDNYNRYELFADSIASHYSGVPQLVLADPMQSNFLITDGWMYSLRNAYDNPLKTAQEVFIRDYAGNSLHNFDTLMRGGDTTIFHMKRDSTEWWIAVNLRRLVNDAQNSIADSTSVLSIRLPLAMRYDSVDTGGVHHIRRDTVYVTFDSIAVVGTDTVVHDWLGKMDGALSASNTTTFIIRKGMLPAFDASPRPDITLSAHFWLPKTAIRDRYKLYDALNDSNLYSSALRLPPPSGFHDPFAISDSAFQNQSLSSALITPSPPSVDTIVERLLMQVTYHGNVDVGLDWLRIEDRITRQTLRGMKDSVIIHRVRDIYRTMDSSTGVHSNATELFRFYLADEVPAVYWRMQRYIHSLLQHSGTIETDQFFLGEYKHQSNANEAWVAWGSMGVTGAPFLRYGATDGSDSPNIPYNQRDYRTMKIPCGYRGTKDKHGAVSATGFDYETYLVNDTSSTPLSQLPDSIYLQILKNARGAGAQPLIEQVIRSISRNDGIIYYKNPFWVNQWLHSDYYGRLTKDTGQYKKKVLLPGYFRAQTGEEARLWCTIPLLLGAKGFLYHLGGSVIPNLSNDSISPTQRDGVGSIWLGLTRNLLRSDHSPGTDFLDAKDTLYQYVDLQAMSAAMGIDTSRFYIGTRSVYQEIYRNNSWIRQNQDQLMRLQLQAVYNKGYKLLQSRRDTSIHIQWFLDAHSMDTISGGLISLDPLPPSAFSVRRIHDRTGHAWTGTDEPFEDSTFFMVTLLKDTTVSMDTVFILSVLNRRTNPTLYYPASSPFGGGTNLGDSIKFFSTVEFDSLLKGGHLSHYAEPVYAQEGSREITLPFNYSSPAGYCLLHIQEVGGGIDTVIGQDNRLAMKFQPGEGKFLKVTILKPGVVSPGLLAYANQRKMVIEQDPADSTKIRYHLVYFTSSGSILYQRSQLIARNSNEENIKWEFALPISISRKIRDSTISSPTVYTSPTCAYPSVLVRRDSVLGRNRVYISFACTSSSAPGEILIAENSFASDKTMLSLLTGQDTLGTVLAHAAGQNLQEWGTPVISAVARGNIYAWSDSLKGIGVGYKRPQDNRLQNTIYVRWASGFCQHPSVNTYARIASGENTCALVWQENNCIHYARPKVDSGTSLSLMQLLSPANTSVVLHTTGKMALISDSACITYNRMPVVYRSLEQGAYSVGIQYPVTQDRIFWEGRDSTKDRTKIYMRSIISLDIFTAPAQMKYAGYFGLGSIWGNLSNLYQPDAAQGKVRWTYGFGGNKLNISDSAYTLTFLSKFFFYPASTAAKIYHVPLRYTYHAVGTMGLADIPQAQVTIELGGYPHLAARAQLDSTDEYSQNRRVFEMNTAPDIVSSAQFFYRQNERGEDAVTPVPGFAQAVCRKYSIFEPWVDDTAVKFVKPTVSYGTFVNPTIREYTDTLRTEWFPIGSLSTISFYALGADTSLVRMELVKQSDSSTQAMALAPATDSTAKLMSYTFSNGGGDDYRIELIKKDTIAQFIEDILIGAIPTLDSLGHSGFARSNQERFAEKTVSMVTNLAREEKDKTVGLHALVYPNPANDRVAISVYRVFDEKEVRQSRKAESLRVEILTSMGQEVRRFEVLSGATIQIETSGLPSGAYFMRIESANRSGEYGSTSFIVRR